jgi:hypothetical protein
MFADTDAIRALGTTNSAHAADLCEVAATLSALSIAPSAVGPAVAGFASALSEAVAEGARAVHAVSERLSASGTVAHAAATAYEHADAGATNRIAGV